MLSSCVLFLIAAGGLTGTTTTAATEALLTHGVCAECCANFALLIARAVHTVIAGGLQTALWFSLLGGI